MKNFPFTYKGEEFWYSRSVAVNARFFAVCKGKVYLLAVKRGTAVDHAGQWGLPGGYLDFDETLREACNREIFEETGLEIENLVPDSREMLDNPEYSQKQTLTAMFTFTHYWDELPSLTNSNAEPNEIAEVKWIKLSDFPQYKWMYNRQMLNEIKL